MKKLEEFKKKIKPMQRKSILDEFFNEINDLLKDGYSIRQIYQYLKEYENLSISEQTLYKFVRSRKLRTVSQKNLHKDNSPTKTEDFFEKETMRLKDNSSSKKVKNSFDLIANIKEKFQECSKKTDIAFNENINFDMDIDFSINGLSISSLDNRLTEIQKKYLFLKYHNKELINRCKDLNSLIKTWDRMLFPVKYDGQKMVFSF